MAALAGVAEALTASDAAFKQGVALTCAPVERVALQQRQLVVAAGVSQHRGVAIRGCHVAEQHEDGPVPGGHRC